jgi:probable phosphoglycerate mutase
LDIPLSEEGTRQIARTAEDLAGLEIACVYCAPSQASQETAERLGETLKVKTKTLDKLRNLDHGLWQGMLIDEVRTKQPKVYRRWQEQPDTVCPPEGEMLVEARQRVHEALEKLIKRHKHGVVAIVAPEPLASLVRCHFNGGTLGDLWKAERQCGGWEPIDIQSSKSANAP